VTSSLPRMCSTTELQQPCPISIDFEKRVMGIEPTWPAWKAGALPLSYTRGCSNLPVTVGVARTRLRPVSRSRPFGNLHIGRISPLHEDSFEIPPREPLTISHLSPKRAGAPVRSASGSDPPHEAVSTLSPLRRLDRPSPSRALPSPGSAHAGAHPLEPRERGGGGCLQDEPGPVRRGPLEVETGERDVRERRSLERELVTETPWFSSLRSVATPPDARRTGAGNPLASAESRVLNPDSVGASTENPGSAKRALEPEGPRRGGGPGGSGRPPPRGGAARLGWDLPDWALPDWALPCRAFSGWGSPMGLGGERREGGRAEKEWGREDSNLRSIAQQIYSLSPLTTREHPHRSLPLLVPPRPGPAHPPRGVAGSARAAGES
jgi:hypothetical protein